MAVGTISTPASWVNGTVAPSTWFTNVQDTLNALYAGLSGSGAGTFKSLHIDGTGGQTIGADSGQLRIQQATDANKPMVLTRNQGGSNRFLVDHNGFPMGAGILTLKENWFSHSGALPGAYNATLDTADQQWLGQNFSTTGAGTIDVVFPSGQTFHSQLLTQMSTTAADRIARYIRSPVVNAVAHLSLVLEFSLLWGGEAANTSVMFELRDSYGGSAEVVGVRKTPASTNWRGITTHSSTTTDTDLGVATSASFQRFRVELHGASAPGGARALFFINETLCGTSTTNLPTGELFLAYEIKNTNAPAGSTTLSVGPIRAAYVTVASPGAL